VTENERLRLTIHKNILATSPYLVVHTVRIIQQPNRPLPLPAPNIHHQVQCNPCVNISTANGMNVLRNTVALEKPFPISSADRTAPAMTASVCDTFVFPLFYGSTCDIPMYYCPSLTDTIYCPSLTDTIVLPQHFTSLAIHDRRYNGDCIIDMPSCCHIILSHSHDNDA
jgi:hypothetical protein